ncbi:hydantoinase/carbamoylase family amidase [Rhizobium lusitanum]|uniref:hydantoinase/carbamoylase family amidase n=1 Tax=Rhizobium lusitanum TaxID=293958 RepID=UPI00195BACB5|nr:hydantoinase/carbamoylase family amidase [Rhizobium lusitanum]MBM7046566.1 hydantoinase/carbamoylase family amidase [Rhizobium lusitanum]
MNVEDMEIGIEAGLAFAEPLFDVIGERSFDGIGFTRAAYGPGEQMAHNVVAQAGRDLGLRVELDAALNLSMTLAGKDGNKPPLMIGSHLDAVPQGGNFDGLAGVLAGLATVAAIHKSGRTLQRDLVVLAIRAEESAWFGAQHIGSRALLGTLPTSVLQTARRVDTGRRLAEHMHEAGVDIDRLKLGLPLKDPSSIGGYIELHIEQGPILVDQGLSIGVVQAIRGNRRCRHAVCRGTYGHSGTVPRIARHDAVFAVAELVSSMDESWRMIEEEEKGDLVLTFGQFFTDPGSHSVTTVPGQVTFSFDARSHSAITLQRVERELIETADRIAARRGVTFEFAPLTGDEPVAMDTQFHETLLRGAEHLGLSAISLMSGAGHDAGDFASAGVPSAMIFVRNDKGSHNPEEAMEMSDLAEAVRLLTWFVNHIDEELS